MLVKICGLSNIVDAQLAYEYGADALGFVMGGSVLPIEIEATAQQIRPFLRTLKKPIQSFLVTHLLEARDIIALASYLEVTGIQISEPLTTDQLKYIRNHFSGQIIKTVVVDRSKSFQELDRVSQYSDFILLDTRHAGYIGGTGVVNDWDLCREIIQISKLPVFLAGGLTPDNINTAIKYTRTSAVDVSTGVSYYNSNFQRKDRKDPKKIKSFIDRAKELA